MEGEKKGSKRGAEEEPKDSRREAEEERFCSVQQNGPCFMCSPWMRSFSEFFSNKDHVRRGNAMRGLGSDLCDLCWPMGGIGKRLHGE